MRTQFWYIIQRNLKSESNFSILYRGILNQDAIMVNYTEESYIRTQLWYIIQRNLKWGRNYGILYRGILYQDAILVLSEKFKVPF